MMLLKLFAMLVAAMFIFAGLILLFFNHTMDDGSISRPAGRFSGVVLLVVGLAVFSGVVSSVWGY